MDGAVGFTATTRSFTNTHTASLGSAAAAGCVGAEVGVVVGTDVGLRVGGNAVGAAVGVLGSGVGVVAGEHPEIIALIVTTSSTNTNSRLSTHHLVSGLYHITET